MPDSSTAPDPGLAGVVPFRFACQRSGRCCTTGAGYVWVEVDELDALARAAGRTREGFERDFLRSVRDPRSGMERLSLREGPACTGSSGARCALLEGERHCTVYDARPRHCRSFPYWPSILEDKAGFEAARSTCPGIAVVTAPGVRAEAFEQLEALYRELDEVLRGHNPRCEMSGVCCRFEEAGHLLYATALETDYAVARHPQAPAPEAAGRCPYHVRGICTAREGRPLGCRTYYCDSSTEEALQEAHETFLAAVRAIEQSTRYPRAYAPFPALLEARGLGRGVERPGNSGPAADGGDVT